MNTIFRLPGARFAAALIVGFLLYALPSAQAARPAAAQAQTETAAQSAAEARLRGKQFQQIKVSVESGIATLTGSVDLYEFKADAEKRVRHAKGITAVRNLVEVAGPAISDKDLQEKLGEKLAYDRVGYGNVFNAISLRVENGVAFLGGHARTYVDKDSALSLASTTPGVKDVVDNVEVDPVSLVDDHLRFAVARAVYGFSTLNRYAIDPAKPIRISVQNGNVELYGTVDSQADKDAAYIRANGVSGVFKVTNFLEVANQQKERR